MDGSGVGVGDGRLAFGAERWKLYLFACCMDCSGAGVGDRRLALAFGVWVVFCLRERFLVKFKVATANARWWSKILLQPEEGTGTSSSLTTP